MYKGEGAAQQSVRIRLVFLVTRFSLLFRKNNPIKGNWNKIPKRNNMKKPTPLKTSFIKAIRRRGRVQQLEWEKLNGRLRAKVIDTKKTTKQERKLFRRKPLYKLIDGE